MGRSSFEEIMKKRKQAKENGTYVSAYKGKVVQDGVRHTVITKVDPPTKTKAGVSIRTAEQLKTMAPIRTDIKVPDAASVVAPIKKESSAGNTKTTTRRQAEQNIKNKYGSYEDFLKQAKKGTMPGTLNDAASKTAYEKLISEEEKRITSGSQFYGITNETYQNYLDTFEKNAKDEKQKKWLESQKKNLTDMQDKNVRNAVADYVTGDSNFLEYMKKSDAEYVLKKMGYSESEIKSLADTYKREQNAKESQNMMERADKLTDAGAFGKVGAQFLGFGAAVSSAPSIILHGLEDVKNGITGEYAPADTNQFMDMSAAFSGRVKENIKKDITGEEEYEKAGKKTPILRKGAGVLYDAATSAAESLLLAPLPGGLAIMSGEAAGDTYRDTFARTGKNSNALATGIVSGAIEAATEHLPLDNLWDIMKNSGKAALRKTMVNILAQSGIEGIEEMTSEALNTLADSIINQTDSNLSRSKESYQAEGKTEKEAWQLAFADAGKQVLNAGLVGALSGGIGAGAASAVSPKMSKNEQKVIDAEMENRIKKAKDEGTKLSAKEKADIREKVTEDFAKGRISIDTIENALGGETKTAYEELFKESEEFRTLNRIKAGELTGEQSDRLLELKEKNKKKSYESALQEMKEKLSMEVDELTKSDPYIRESYNERERRSKAFEADLSQYKNEYQRKTVENAIGKINNTNLSHDFVDFLGKVAKDKSVVIDLTNNKRLKGTAFEIGGKTVNGYVEGNTITLNTDSNNWMNTIVGHEVLHVLEGTAHFDTLKSALFEYAKTKGEYKSRLEYTKELYKSMKDANVENELAAELVGEYIFGDEKFVKSLSAEQPNVFKRIYGEIKYLLKCATTGSKEERQLLKVKKVFEEVYRENGKTDESKIKYDIKKNKIIDLSEDSELTKRVSGLNGSEKYKEIQKYILDVLSDQPIKLSDGKEAIVDRRDALHIANKSASRKTAQIAKIKEIVEKAELYAEDKNVEHNKFNYFCYYKADVRYRGEEFSVYLNVGKGKNDGSYHVYDITDKIRDTAGRINGLERPKPNEGYALQTVSHTKRIPQNQKNATENSEKSSINIANIEKQIRTQKYETLAAYGKDGKLIFRKDGNKKEIALTDAERQQMNGAIVTHNHTEGNRFSDDDILTFISSDMNELRLVTNDGMTCSIKRVDGEQQRGLDLFKDYFKLTITKEREFEDFYIKRIERDGLNIDDDLASSDKYYEKVRREFGANWLKENASKYGYKYSEEIKTEKIKSATDNIGTFDGNNPDIRYSLSNNNNAVRTKGWQVSGKDLAIAPIGENVKRKTNTESVVPDDFPIRKDIAPAQRENKNKNDTFSEVGDALSPNPNVQNELQSEVGNAKSPNPDVQNALPSNVSLSKDSIPQSEENGTKKFKRSEYHKTLVDGIKKRFSEEGFDFDEVLNKAKNKSTWSSVDNTPQRFMEKTFGYKEGQILSDLTVNQTALNESEAIKWLNSYTDRKSGILAQICERYHIKPGSKESAAAQMYGEGFYVNKAGDYVEYGDAELAKDFKDPQVQRNIKSLAKDPQIREIYDDTLNAINESRKRNGYPEIPRRNDYFLHFRAMDDTFSRIGIPFNPNDIRAKDLPTDINGMTADLKPGQPYFASAMQRKGKRTTYDLIGGLERYLTSAKNQIYHIDDIQTLRALRNYIADTYGQAKGLESLDEMSEEEAAFRIEQVYKSHLSTFAKFLNEQANAMAGKTALIDRGLEGIIGRRGLNFLDTVNKQAGSNMVGFNVSSALTNIVPAVQAFAKGNKFDAVRALAQTVSNKLGKINGKSDGFAEEDPFIIRRKGAEKFTQTPYEKVRNAGYVLAGAIDDSVTEFIVRMKYNELTRKGMDGYKAHIEADKWAARILGDRSYGQQPLLYNSKTFGLVTKFQLEVRNQLDSLFYDTIQETKVSTEEIQDAVQKNTVRAAKITCTFVELAVLQHVAGMALEAAVGYNPFLDIIDVLIKTFGWDDDEDSEDTALDNLEQGFFALLEDLPYTSTLKGGRIPIASALPVTQFINGEDEYGNEKSRWKILGEAAPYYILPGGYGQLKKSVKGLSMFDKDLPVSGSYTNSGKLRFPVADTPKNRVQAAVFGQYANENARAYFDGEHSPLTEKQVEEWKALDIPIADYWKIKEGMKGMTKLKEKGDYIGNLDLPIAKKNILINNVTDRKNPIDMTDYDEFEDWEAFDKYLKQNTYN